MTERKGLAKLTPIPSPLSSTRPASSWKIEGIEAYRCVHENRLEAEEGDGTDEGLLRATHDRAQ